jgi:hypothetical protein
MDDNTFWFRIARLVAGLLLSLMLIMGGYNCLDRYLQGHYVITYPQTVTPTK